MERTIVQLVLMDETGDSYYRMRWPGRDLSVKAPNWRVISLDARASERFEWALNADLLILFQSNDYDLIPIIRERQAAGKKTLVEYNDNFYDPPITSPVFDAWSNPLIWNAYEKIMNAGDALIVTGPGLKKLFSDKTKNPIHEIKNQLPDEQLPEFESLWPDMENIHLGWGGSQGHLPDLFSFMPEIHELLREFPKLKLHLMGNEAIPQYLDIPSDRFSFTSWGSMRQYFQFLEKLHLGFAPLRPTPYNNCRSDIKAVEMASRGALPILPKMLPYEEFSRETSLSGYTSLQDFKEKLRVYLQDPAKLREDAEKAYNYVKLKRLENQHRDRLELCLQMMHSGETTFRHESGPGYFEVRGTQGVDAPSTASLKRIQEAFNAGQRAAALSLLKTQVEQNSANPELAISYIKALRLLKSPELFRTIEEFKKVFPQDLRFHLLKIESSEMGAVRLNAWKEIVQILKSAQIFHRKFFREAVHKAFIRDLQFSKDFLELTNKLLDIYPDSAALRFQQARWLESGDQNADALSHFQSLLSDSKSYQENRDFLANIHGPELQMFKEASLDNMKRLKRS